MLIAFEEIRFKELFCAYVLLGGKIQQYSHGACVVELEDGLEPLNIHRPKSNSGIRFVFHKDYVEIQQLHVTEKKRGQGLADKFFQLLLKCAKGQGIESFFVISKNDDFWLHMKEKYKQFVWDVWWEKDSEEFSCSEYVGLFW